VTVLNASILLISGSIWAKRSWGVWWLWSPRLTFSLLLWLLYALYLLLRTVVRVPEKRLSVCATYGTIAFLDVPLVYLSVNLLPDVHPQSSGFGPGTTALMWVSLAGFTAFSSGLIAFGVARHASTGRPGGESPTSSKV
jgi:heme exporter protein C